ncbi:polycystin-2-like protein 1 [Culicoides brevitarsis]|uniref:polycystin-2-like protein 1 n=1 Tax=Culicoides brevitarsis TaxID=469753 RepID=UPI00307C5490
MKKSSKALSELPQQQYNDKHLRKLLLELIFYLIFLTIITTLSLNLAGSSYYYLTKVVIDTFEEEKFSVDDDGSHVVTNFKELATVEELWKWFDVVFLPSFTYESGHIYVADENKLLGPPRIVQVRVTNETCHVPDLFKNHFRECFGYFDDGNTDHKSFGYKNSSAWNYHGNKNNAYIDGEFGFYPTSSFVQVLTLDHDTNKEIIDELYRGNWIDRATRAVFIEFSMYNANLDMLCFVQLVTKIPTGMLVTTSNVQSLHLLNLSDNYDIFLLCLEIILIPFTICYTVEEFCEMYRHRLAYCKKLWNLIDLTIAATLYVGMAFVVYRETFIGEKLERHVNAPREFVNFETFAQRQKQFKNLVGVCLFLAWIKSLKYLSFNKTMMQFSTTLARCSRDLFGFGLMFGIVFVAYAQLGYIAFGNELEDFHTFLAAIFTLFRTILGEFDYLEIEQANHILGPIYFMSYIFFVFFVLLNMFLAIINDTYSDIKNEIQQDSIPVGKFLARKLTHYWNKVIGKSGDRDVDESFVEPKMETLTIESSTVQNDEIISNDSRLADFEERVTLLETEFHKIVARIDSFIENVTRTLHEVDEETEEVNDV